MYRFFQFTMFSSSTLQDNWQHISWRKAAMYCVCLMPALGTGWSFPCVGSCRLLCAGTWFGLSRRPSQTGPTCMRFLGLWGSAITMWMKWSQPTCPWSKMTFGRNRCGKGRTMENSSSIWKNWRKPWRLKRWSWKWHRKRGRSWRSDWAQ